MFIHCNICQNIVTEETSTKSGTYYDSNVKLGVGKYHFILYEELKYKKYVTIFLLSGFLDAGMGATGVNTLLLALNIPSISNSSLKRYERPVGVVIEELAERTCADAIVKEKLLILKSTKVE